MSSITVTIPEYRVFRVMSLGGLAELILALDPKVDYVKWSRAAVVLLVRLQEFNGAMWVGAPLRDRHSVIRALKSLGAV